MEISETVADFRNGPFKIHSRVELSYGSNVRLFDPTPGFPSKRFFASPLNGEGSMSCRTSSRLPTITQRIAMSR